MTIPLTIIGGYLGAGKTTLVNHLLRNANGLRLAILVNEFGALPIDEDLIEARDEDMIAIAGGCVCCSYGNDLTRALMRMAEFDPAPDHVLLEASGVAIPGAIAASVSLLQGYRLDGILVLADTETIREQATASYVGDTVARQLDDADLVVLNKVDLVDRESLLDVRRWLHDRLPSVTVIEASHGQLPLDVLLGRMPSRMPTLGTPNTGDAHPFDSSFVDVPEQVEAAQLADALAAQDLGLIRAKGFVRDRDGDLRAIQTVGRRWDIKEAPGGAQPGMVVIGIKGTLDLGAVRRTMANAERK